MAGMTARCGINDLDTDKGEVGGSSPPRPTIPFVSVIRRTHSAVIGIIGSTQHLGTGC